MRRFAILAFTFLALTGVLIYGSFWFNTQPVMVVTRKLDTAQLINLPEKNKTIIDFIETEGKKLAPNYRDVVCTEFVIAILNNLGNLTSAEMNDIRIITSDDLKDLISTGSPEIRGIQTALAKTNKGVRIDNVDKVRPGDFVQFWNIYNGNAYGHCGVVFEMEPGETMTLYSSHPLTDGYGKQVFLWPDKLFFVRLK